MLLSFPFILIPMDKRTRERWGAKRVKKDDTRMLLIGVGISTLVIILLCASAMILSFDKANPERMDEEEYHAFVTELHNISFNVSEGNQRFLSEHFMLPFIKYLYFIRNEENPEVLDMIFVTKRIPICISIQYREGLAMGEIHDIPFLIYYDKDAKVMIMKFFDHETKAREFNRSTITKV